ncbi:MAG: hypothetical protein EA422_05980 [Gemmatimonadales bacterium]|nr:MAG: hypothetical protein EA422_05980 [Gemmatimonadales bacterium]
MNHPTEVPVPGERIIDDFSEVDRSTAGAWRFLGDRVMGGVSQGSATVGEVAGRRALRLTGRVSLERGGGFIQVVRPLGRDDGRPMDASAWRGIGATVRGDPGSYFLHLRTVDTRAPWQHYSVPLPVDGTWRSVELMWSEFLPISLRRPLDVSKLLRIGLVAGRASFQAHVALARLTLLPRRT